MNIQYVLDCTTAVRRLSTLSFHMQLGLFVKVTSVYKIMIRLSCPCRILHNYKEKSLISGLRTESRKEHRRSYQNQHCFNVG